MADDDNSNAVTNGDSVAAAAIFASLFAVLLIAHAGFLARHRAWFCIPFIVGATSTSLQFPSYHLSPFFLLAKITPPGLL